MLICIIDITTNSHIEMPNTMKYLEELANNKHACNIDENFLIYSLCLDIDYIIMDIKSYIRKGFNKACEILNLIYYNNIIYFELYTI